MPDDLRTEETESEYSDPQNLPSEFDSLLEEHAGTGDDEGDEYEDEAQPADEGYPEDGGDPALDEPTPTEEAVQPTVAALPTFVPNVTPGTYTDVEEETLATMLESGDGRQMFQAQQFMLQRQAEATLSHMTAFQLQSGADPVQVLAQENMLQLAKQFGQGVFQDKKAMDRCRASAMYKIADQSEDFFGSLTQMLQKEGKVASGQVIQQINQPAAPPVRPKATPQPVAPAQRMTQPVANAARPAPRPTGNDAKSKLAFLGFSEDTIEDSGIGRRR